MNGRVLVAGIGNVFFADDGFGVEVARRLLRLAWPDGVRVIDVGIRGMHLAFDLLDPPGFLILVDATARGGEPGTLYVIEPSMDAAAEPAEAHSISIPGVFASVRAMGGTMPRTVVVGCEPLIVGERFGLSPVVEQAAEEAVRLVRELVHAEVSGAGPDVGVEAGS